MSVIIENELRRSCFTLFGPRFDFSDQTLQELGASGIKSAFRKKALETHPDLALSRGDLSQGAERFIAVQQAYERLRIYLNGRDKVGRQSSYVWPTAARPTASFDPNRSSRTINDLFKGPLPRRQLLFGHFLYYSGVASFNMIGKAIIWQRLQRPRLGELGLDFGWLTRNDLERIVRAGSPRQFFGEAAIAMGLLNRSQVERLLKKQASLEKKLGEYFVEQGVVTRANMDELIKKFETHNAQYPHS